MAAGRVRQPAFGPRQAAEAGADAAVPPSPHSAVGSLVAPPVQHAGTKRRQGTKAGQQTAGSASSAASPAPVLEHAGTKKRKGSTAGQHPAGSASSAAPPAAVLAVAGPLRFAAIWQEQMTTGEKNLRCASCDCWRSTKHTPPSPDASGTR